jgi:hypothetical protein
MSVGVAFCGGNASPDDVHLAARIVAIDLEIIRVIERRERRRSKYSAQRDAEYPTEPAC